MFIFGVLIELTVWLESDSAINTKDGRKWLGYIICSQFLIGEKDEERIKFL